VDWEGEAKVEVCRSRMGNHPALGQRRRHCGGWTVHAPKVSMAGRQGDPVASGSAAVQPGGVLAEGDGGAEVGIGGMD